MVWLILKIISGIIFILLPGFILRDNFKKHPILSILAMILGGILLYLSVIPLLTTESSVVENSDIEKVENNENKFDLVLRTYINRKKQAIVKKGEIIELYVEYDNLPKSEEKAEHVQVIFTFDPFEFKPTDIPNFCISRENKILCAVDRELEPSTSHFFNIKGNITKKKEGTMKIRAIISTAPGYDYDGNPSNNVSEVIIGVSKSDIPICGVNAQIYQKKYKSFIGSDELSFCKKGSLVSKMPTFPNSGESTKWECKVPSSNRSINCSAIYGGQGTDIVIHQSVTPPISRPGEILTVTLTVQSLNVASIAEDIKVKFYDFGNLEMNSVKFLSTSRANCVFEVSNNEISPLVQCKFAFLTPSEGSNFIKFKAKIKPSVTKDFIIKSKVESVTESKLTSNNNTAESQVFISN